MEPKKLKYLNYDLELKKMLYGCRAGPKSSDGRRKFKPSFPLIIMGKNRFPDSDVPLTMQPDEVLRGAAKANGVD